MSVPYFPISSPGFEMTMNARAYDGPLIEVDLDRYTDQIERRRALLASDADDYHACPDPAARAAARETLEIVLADMANRYPEWFTLEHGGEKLTWENRLLNERHHLREGSTGMAEPLLWLGGQIQEDLILMRQAGAGTPGDDGGPAACAGGCLCFAAGWSLGDKLGKSFLAIHEEVPGFAEQIGAPSDALMRRLKPGRTVMRCNWTISESDDLNRAPKLRHTWLPKGLAVTPENAGERCYFRVEKQTLTRLPRTGAILFTIHTYIHTIAEVCADPERKRLVAAAIRGMPDAMVRYKGAAAYYDALVEYFSRQPANNPTAASD